jgi:hypothetical protein
MTAVGALSNSADGWIAYSPLGRPPTRIEQLRARWNRTLLRRLIGLPRTMRAAAAAYVEELGRG